MGTPEYDEQARQFLVDAGIFIEGDQVWNPLVLRVMTQAVRQMSGTSHVGTIDGHPALINSGAEGISVIVATKEDGYTVTTPVSSIGAWIKVTRPWDYDRGATYPYRLECNVPQVGIFSLAVVSEADLAAPLGAIETGLRALST